MKGLYPRRGGRPNPEESEKSQSRLGKMAEEMEKLAEEIKAKKASAEYAKAHRTASGLVKVGCMAVGAFLLVTALVACWRVIAWVWGW